MNSILTNPIAELGNSKFPAVYYACFTTFPRPLGQATPKELSSFILLYLRLDTRNSNRQSVILCNINHSHMGAKSPPARTYWPESVRRHYATSCASLLHLPYLCIHVSQGSRDHIRSFMNLDAINLQMKPLSIFLSCVRPLPRKWLTELGNMSWY